MTKRNLALIFGGNSSEHEISCLSAASIRDQLPQERYEIYQIGITRQGNWYWYHGPSEGIADGSWEKHPQNQTAFFPPDPQIHGLLVQTGTGFETIPMDVVFPVLHGRNGEDGTIQGLLELSGVPYVGCRTAASAVCMDKVFTNLLLDAFEIPQAEFLWFYAGDYADNKEAVEQAITERLHGYPIFVKPANAGSSVGVSKVHDASELDAAVLKAAKEDAKILLEEAIEGQEVECAVFGNGSPQASVVGEVLSDADFYDYADKYQNGTSRTQIPANLPSETVEQIRSMAIHAYHSLGCTGLARVDFFVRKSDGAPLLNELNTLPGFTSVSMYPKLWEAAGLKYPDLLEKLIALAVEASEDTLHG